MTLKQEVKNYWRIIVKRFWETTVGLGLLSLVVTLVQQVAWLPLVLVLLAAWLLGFLTKSYWKETYGEADGES